LTSTAHTARAAVLDQEVHRALVAGAEVAELRPILEPGDLAVQRHRSANGGAWSDSSKWSAGVPDGSEDVCIQRAATTRDGDREHGGALADARVAERHGHRIDHGRALGAVTARSTARPRQCSSATRGSPAGTRCPAEGRQ
jgi:hypothetical protein